MNVKFIKHTADNRWGFTADTVADAVTLLIANIQVALVGVPQHDAMRNQLFGSTFGRHPFRVPDLNNVELHCDRGYFSEATFLAILLEAGCWLTCTCPRGKWLPFHTVYEGDSIDRERSLQRRALEQVVQDHQRRGVPPPRAGLTLVEFTLP